MEATILYYDGCSACPKEVRVLLLDDQLQVQTNEDFQSVQCFAFSGMAYNIVGNSHYLYLDAKGIQYLQFPLDYIHTDALLKKVDGHNQYWGQGLLKQKTSVLFCLMIVLGIGLYMCLIYLIPFSGSRIIGVEEEIQLGFRLKEMMLEEAALLGAKTDSAGTKKLQAFADKLALSKQYPIQLTLIESDIVNAYALPGGQVVVYTGILKKINTPEALVALLAHESSHVNERHSLKALLRNAANSILISVVFNDASGVSGAVVGNANTLNGLRYSRTLEFEADKKGCDVLMENNLDVKGMLELLYVLEKLGDMPHTLSFLSTHPLTKERLEATKLYMENHPQKVEQPTDLKVLFQSLKETMK